MNSRTLWIAVVVVIIVVWLLFLVAGAFSHWNGRGKFLANLGIPEREKAAPDICANCGDSMSRWRGQVWSNWHESDVETGLETILPARPENVLEKQYIA
jgi:hypothetical protein